MAIRKLPFGQRNLASYLLGSDDVFTEYLSVFTRAVLQASTVARGVATWESASPVTATVTPMTVTQRPVYAG